MRIPKLLLAVCLATPLAGFAADSVTAGLTRPGPPPVERLVKPLGLSAEQQARLKPIFAQAQAQAVSDLKEATGEGQKPEPAALTAKQKMREADLRVRLASVLTPEQVTRYEQLVANAGTRADSEMFPGHGHRDADNAATASETPDTSADRPTEPPPR